MTGGYRVWGWRFGRSRSPGGSVACRGIEVIEFGVLGSLEVVDRDGRLALGAPKQRALLAVLLLRRGEPVSSDRLIDEVWGDQPPATATKLVHGYVSSLRKVLGDGLLLTEGRGYVLRVSPGQLDVDRFEALVRRGREALERGDPLTAASVLREALAVWRGPALADFAYEPFAQAEIARLEESRLAALEDRVDADLASGEQARLVGELEGLVREHPLRERLRAQLMLALYRSGRQADALEAYQHARRELLDGLGLEPGRALQELERAILAHDPGLDLPARRTPTPHESPRSRQRGAVLIAVAGALLLAVIVAIAAKLASSGASTVRVAPNDVAVIDTRNDHVVGAIPVGDQPGPIAFGSGSLWVANLGDQNISRIDPGAQRTLRNISVSSSPTGIAATASGLWVVESPNTNSVLVDRVDPEFDRRAETVARIGNVVPDGPGAIATNGHSVWVAPSTGDLTRLDGTSGKPAWQLDPNASPAGIAVGEDAIWLTDPDAGNVVRVDPSGLLTPITVGNAPTGIAVGGGGVWVADSLDDAVVRIDPDTRSVTATIPVGRSPAGVAYGAGSVWVADSGDGTVTRIDPHTRKPRTITVGGSPQAITIADGKAWVTVDEQTIPQSRGAPDSRTLRLVSTSDVPSLDPANSNGAFSDSILYATCAQLLNYPDKADVLCQPPSGIADVGLPSSASRSALRAAGSVTAAPSIRWVAARSGREPDGVGTVTVQCCCRARCLAGS